ALAVGVERDTELALRRIGSDALQQLIVPHEFPLVHLSREFHGDVIGAERFGDVPDVIVLLVGHVHRGRKLEGVDAHTGVVVHFPERFVLVHGDGESPVLHFGLGFLQGGLLLGRHLSAAASSALSLPAAGGAWSRTGSPTRSAAGSALSATRATGAARAA